MRDDPPIPADSFMGRYLAYMRNQETALTYDIWCALWCIGTACARATYVDRPRAPVYLNMYAILVGESGIARKTTAVTTAAKIARTVVDRYNDIGFLDAKLTPEALDKLLHERTAEFGNAQLCAAVPELAVFMGTERYIASMPTLLTDLYDCPAARDGGGTIARGAIVQRNVWIHFLSASTPTWLLRTVNPNVIEGGFTSRCYFVVANQPKQRIAWPRDTDRDLFRDLCEDLAIISDEARARQPIRVHPTALEMFVKWYDTRTHAIDPYKQSFEAREDAHVLRVAALLCINDGSWRINEQHIAYAIDLLVDIKNNSATIFDTSRARDKYAAALDAIRMQLLAQGIDPIPRHSLYLRIRRKVGNQEFMALLDVLQELGAIQRFDMTNRRGRPIDLIRGTKKLLDSNLGDKVVAHFS